MRDAMRHGGPDAEGIYIYPSIGLAFGHRRLSIIDLSKLVSQPMQRDGLTSALTGKYIITLSSASNCISTGQHFSTNSDTEVIIRAYQQWGLNVLAASVVCSPWLFMTPIKVNSALARDHAGIKPLLLLPSR